jgi:transposase
MDETRWMVFAEVQGKSGYRWWLWVIVTKDTVAYILDPSRSGEIPRNHLGEEAQGILSVDRYAAYKTLGEKISIAFCWTHVRRDFLEIRNGYRRLCVWAQTWVDRINELFRMNRQRLSARSQPEVFGVHDHALREALSDMARERDRQLEDPSLHPAARGALSSLKNHWEGLLIFVDHPEIPMDNSEAERRLRNPVVGRKNYYGSGSIWSGALAACAFTIFQTLLTNEIHPQKFLEAYFEACAQGGGQVPKDLERFLPWNLSSEQKDAWSYQSRSP